MTSPLQHLFADALPELATASHAAPAPEATQVVLNSTLATELGLDPVELATPAGVQSLIGGELPADARPVAQHYAGHQFGGFSPTLGDGRALLLGEIDTPLGLLDVHLKGSGRTPLSRGGDGLAALGPMLREYVVSESLHALGLPTTRALAVTATGGEVARDEGPGGLRLRPAAVLTRVAASHLRVGSFQYVRATGDEALLRRLLDFAIERHVPAAGDAENPALAFFTHVRDVQAILVARWMLVGFVHGVMNTDNMTISGESIDFGPCAFLDAYDPGAVFSSIDERGRYAYGNQPPIAQWNLARLAECLLPLIHEDEDEAIKAAMAVLDGYALIFNAAWMGGMRAKLGLATVDPALVNDEALAPLVGQLLDLLQASRVDWTGFWVALGACAQAGTSAPARDLFTDREAFDAWAVQWLELGPDAEFMAGTNPVRIPRNHLVDEALTAAEAGNLTPVRDLVAALQEPYGARPEWERYSHPAPEAFADGFRTYCGT